MRRSRAIAAALVAAIAAVGWQGAATWRRHADEAAVQTVVQAYFDGMMNGSPETLRAAFDHDAVLLGAGHGAPVRIPFEEWAAKRNKPLGSDGGTYDNRIADIDVSGDAAMAKTVLEWPTTRYVDYLSLLKIDGEWKIVNKTWHQEPSAAVLARIDETPVDRAELARYAGRYRAGDTDLEVWVDGDRLALAKVGSSPIVLFHVGDATFAPSFDPDGRVVFREVGEGVRGFELTYGDTDVVARRVE